MSNIASSGDGAELRKKSMWGNKTGNNLQETSAKDNTDGSQTQRDALK